MSDFPLFVGFILLFVLGFVGTIAGLDHMARQNRARISGWCEIHGGVIQSRTGTCDRAGEYEGRCNRDRARDC